MTNIAAICLLGMCAVASAQQPWEADEFPIGCWRGPNPAHNTLEHYQTVKDCSFNIVGPTGGYDVEGNQEVLDLCEQVGLRAILVDGRISPHMTQRDDWQELVGEIVADYGSSPGLYGYYLQDEPNYLNFEPLGKMSREFERRDPTHLPYINLFPTYANVKQLGTPTYADHLDKFMSIVTPRVISYDHYALRKDGSTRPDYFENMELVRDQSLRAGIPWWYVHNSGAYSGYRVPTEAEMRWQVYTSLAYGTKGISYWYYWGREQEGDDRSGVVDREGKPTWLYTILQQVNAETRTLGNVLLPLVSTGVFHVGEIPAGTRRLGTDAIIGLPDDQPLMVGLFRGEDDAQYAMVVNRDHASPVEFEASFLPHVVGVQRISAEDGTLAELALTEGSVSIALPPGDGALLRLTTEFDYPEAPPTLTEIDFQFDGDGDLEGWGSFAGLSGATVGDGALTMTLGTRDPHFERMYLRIAPDTYKALRVRMSVTGGDAMAQVFWITSEEPALADTRYMNFPIVPDGEWHEYEIPVGEHERWAGQEIRGLRLDPSTGGAEPVATVRIDWIMGVPGE
jgi:hypothetical protein